MKNNVNGKVSIWYMACSLILTSLLFMVLIAEICRCFPLPDRAHGFHGFSIGNFFLSHGNPGSQ